MQDTSQRYVYIYSLCCPEDGLPRYVGATINLKQRMSLHYSRSHSRPLRNWIRSLRGLGLRPRVRVLAQVHPGIGPATEARWIDWYIRKGYPILNEELLRVTLAEARREARQEDRRKAQQWWNETHPA